MLIGVDRVWKQSAACMTDLNASQNIFTAPINWKEMHALSLESHAKVDKN
jgi:hypothetical protein